MFALRVLLVCVTVTLFINLSASFRQLEPEWKARVDPKFILKNGIIGPKVVGGVNANQYQSPWQVSVAFDFKYQGDEYLAHICGGSIITQNAVLTAAHCCDDPLFNTTSLKVRYGGTVWQQLSVTTDITKIIIHPKWNFETIDSDFCILHLKDSVQTSSTINIIPIADLRPDDGAQANLTGWGQTNGSDDSSASVTLQFVTLSIISNTDCNQKWEGINRITDNMVCAGQQNASACMGDSGGPLVKDGQLVGVVSWGQANCNPNTLQYPSVYSNPVAVRDWIKDNGANSPGDRMCSLSIILILSIITSIILFNKYLF